MNITLGRKKYETREQCMGRKVKLYDLKKKRKKKESLKRKRSRRGRRSKQIYSRILREIFKE